METPIPLLPYIPGAINPATTYIEVAVPDISSDTGYTSCRAYVNDVSAPLPSFGVSEIVYGDGSGDPTSSPFFVVDDFNGNLGVGDAPPSDTSLYVYGNTGSGEKLMVAYTADGAWEVFKIRQGAIDSRVNNYNFYPSGIVGTGGDPNLNLFSEGGGNPRINFTTTQDNLSITGSSIPVIASLRPELNINAALVGFNLIGLVAEAGVHIHGHGSTSGLAFKVDNSINDDMFKIREDGYSIFRAVNAPLADADLANSEFTAYIDETTNSIIMKVKYSTGTVKTVTLPLI